MSTTLAQSALNQTGNLRLDLAAWASAEQTRADKVAIFRRYDEGDHDANLSEEMRKSLRIADNGVLNTFNDNYVPTVIDTMNDRLTLDGLKTDSEQANTWVEDIMRANRLDQLQGDVHRAAIRDGNTYLMVDVLEDTDERRLRWTHEPAYDGVNGMLLVYETVMSKTPAAAVKIWRVGGETTAAVKTRVNVYYPDRIERYISGAEGGLSPYEDDGQPAVSPWMLGSEPLGIPVFHFGNRSSTYSNYSISEVESIKPLQDALNRTMVSMVSTAEYTGFPVRWGIGFNPPAEIMPGSWVRVNIASESGSAATLPNEGAVNWLNAVRMGSLEQGSLVPFIDQAQWLKNEIFRITNTPDDETAGANSSGESLAQREIKLLGKVERFQTKNGNVWEDVVRMSHRVSSAYIKTPPAFETVDAQWKEAQLRSDTQVVDNILKLANAGYVDQREVLETVASVFGWDAAHIDALVERTTGPEAIPEEPITTPEDLERIRERLSMMGVSANGGNTDTAAVATADNAPNNRI